MNAELNTILLEHVNQNLPKALKTQKFIKWSLQYLVPSVAGVLFLGILGLGLMKYSQSVQSVLFVMLAALLLPLWVVMPLAQLFTGKEFVELDTKGVSRLRMQLDTLNQHIDPLVAQQLNDLLAANTAPAVWWEALEKKTSGAVARLFVRTLDTPSKR